MSIRKKSVLATTALALAFAAGGAAYAADLVLPTKAPPKVEPFFLVNDTSVTFTWYPDATDPGVTARTNRYQGELTHFDVWH